MSARRTGRDIRSDQNRKEVLAMAKKAKKEERKEKGKKEKSERRDV